VAEKRVEISSQSHGIAMHVKAFHLGQVESYFLSLWTRLRWEEILLYHLGSAGLGVKEFIGKVPWSAPSGDHWLEGPIQLVFDDKAGVVHVAQAEGHVESFASFWYILLGDFKGRLAKILLLDFGCDL